MTTVIPRISKLSPRVIRILGCNPGHFTLRGTNTYIIGTGRKRALIDTGEPEIPEYITNLKKTVEDNGITLEKIILTHWHPDHVGGTPKVLSEIASKDCKVYKYKYEHQDRQFAHLFQCQYVNDQDEIEVEGATVKLHLTPGHTKDHLSLFLKEEDSMFSGDCILGEGSVIFEDLLSYLQSLQKILTLSPKKLYPGHGPVVENPIEKINEYIGRRMEREAQIVNSLKNADKFLSPLDIVKQIYRELPKDLMFGAEYNVRHHLEKLHKEDRVDFLEDKEHFEDRYRWKSGD